jgi:amidophosphoribosyltransferase
MLVEMSDRGPDSAGVAIYREPSDAATTKISLFAPTEFNWTALQEELNQVHDNKVSHTVHSTHALFLVPESDFEIVAWLEKNHPELRVMSVGSSIEIYKEKGLPNDFVEEFALSEFQGSHALGHTRMATESAVTTEHSHPFSTGMDLCLVHNGSLSNHNRLRQQLRRRGIEIQTDNDSEVAAGYLMWRMSEGDSLEEALHNALRDLDGFYTLAIGTRDGFAVLRDPIACKPAVLAETDDWVAMASEYRAIAQLDGVEHATIWEPAPATVYAWGGQ